jgi:hypothetical protein
MGESSTKHLVVIVDFELLYVHQLISLSRSCHHLWLQALLIPWTNHGSMDVAKNLADLLLQQQIAPTMNNTTTVADVATPVIESTLVCCPCFED